ncbi:DUF4145 domain-containing protein [Kaistia nematophila]|uniref:DUF4145 domain-containing protein n=1 Tax=Kaistia nematophila TaxID=2994654 RepID=A0A9X3IL92_9HYPH|nr:DUF4145 domain-containing protein [Kaistia nematophila]MCX5569612.1 DUF4145 domain-containing protein [Kaistia nematophila]
MFRFDEMPEAMSTGIAMMVCPACRHAGAFYPIANNTDVGRTTRRIGAIRDGRPVVDVLHAGIRRCPNDKCNALVFVEMKNDKVLVSYPPQVIDFDATNLPPQVLSCLEEAVMCHASACYRASALMVRRSLEEMCVERGARGDNLKARIAELRSTIVISADLLDAADELRLLGNDAAHIEAKTYDAIEAEEVEVAIELTKELLKAVYQHTSLVARLRALKKPSAAPSG